MNPDKWKLNVREENTSLQKMAPAIREKSEWKKEKALTLLVQLIFCL